MSPRLTPTRAGLLLAVLLLGACGGSEAPDAQAGGGDDVFVGPTPEIPETNAPPVTDPFRENGTVLNILPPGQDDNGGLGNANLPLPVPLPTEQLGDLITQVSDATGLVPTLATEPHFMDQLDQYDALVHSAPGLTDDELVPAFFKAEAMRAPDDGPWASEEVISDDRYRVEIKRGVDKGVPHIFGDSRENALFGTGYVTAQDRLFLLDVLRRAGRGELSRFLGPADLSFDQDIAFGAPYREADRTRQIRETAVRLGLVGEQVLQDLDAYVAGLNEYVARARGATQATDAAINELPIEYLALGVPLQDFTREDVHAIATLIQSIFAGGGGGEADNVRLLQALQQQSGDAATACRLWRDIRQAVDPESSVTITDSFATQSPRDYDDNICPLQAEFASRYPGSVVFDEGSFEAHESFRTEPCGRPGQPLCPGPIITGNLPQLPATADPIAIVDDVLDSLLGNLLADSAVRVKPPLRLALAETRAAVDVPAARLAAARARIARMAGGLEQASHGLPNAMSNALLVNGAHTASGNPIAVFGPQTSYFTPQLLLEVAVHGGDMHARGMTFAGLPYVVIGRGTDFAWSATSAASDLTDVRSVQTCDTAEVAPGSDAAPDGVPTGYRNGGVCKPFDFIIEEWPARWNLATPIDEPAAIGQNLAVSRQIIRTEEYGPVFGFATVGGQPVALVRQRSTYGAELDTVAPFFLATRNDVHDAQSFLEVFNTTTGSFNWFYADADDVAYIHSGLYPERAPGVHPDLPVRGDGSHDWQGFIGFDRHPQAINPARGYLSSWNNRPARDWFAADADASRGASDRNEILTVRLEELVAQGNVTRANVVEAMGDAATVDLRGQEILPGALDLLQQGELSNDQQEAVDLLRNWVAAGAMRRDRDDDGIYDSAAAVALMDAWYDPMIEAALPQITAVEANMIMGRHDAPGPMGSAFNDGYYGYLERVFDMALERSSSPYRELRCAGEGGDCRQALLSSLDSALASLGGIGNRADFDADEEGDRIVHRPLGLSAVPAIDWQNRPTFQQVVEFNRRR